MFEERDSKYHEEDTRHQEYKGDRDHVTNQHDGQTTLEPVGEDVHCVDQAHHVDGQVHCQEDFNEEFFVK